MLGFVLVAVGIHRYVDLDNSAAKVVLRDAVVKFNDTELHHWTNLKLSGEGYEGDEQVFDLVKADLLKSFTWQSISSTGGVVSFKGHSFNVKRKQSTHNGYAVWEVSNGQ